MNDAARYDVYKVPHKAQRRALFLTAIAVGRLNPGDAAAGQALAARIRQLVAHLREHSASEDRYIGVLMEKVGHHDEAIAAGHERVEALMAEVERQLDAGALARGEHAFYRLFNRLVSAYVAHMDDEEEAQARWLWPNYNDAALIEAQARFVTQRSPMSSLHDLAFILPSLNVEEICQFLDSLRHDVPDEPFATVLAVARQTLEPHVWSAVESRLARW
jgi:hypothetical protein